MVINSDKIIKTITLLYINLSIYANTVNNIVMIIINNDKFKKLALSFNNICLDKIIANTIAMKKNVLKIRNIS